MSKTLPDAIERRNVLYGDSHTAEQRAELGDAYLEAGRLLDALEFYARADHDAGINKIRERAIAEGNAFLAARIEQLDLTPLDQSQWSTLAREAESRGLDRYAATARERAGENAPDE